MALSEQLSRLSVRTKMLEDRAAAAKDKARVDLEQDVKSAREAAQTNAEQLGQAVDADVADVTAWWDDVSRAWNQHVTSVRQHIDSKVAAHDLEEARRDAEEADDYAAYLVDYTYAAVEEAEYAVLDAVLAHKRADEMASALGTEKAEEVRS